MGRFFSLVCSEFLLEVPALPPLDTCSRERTSISSSCWQTLSFLKRQLGKILWLLDFQRHVVRIGQVQPLSLKPGVLSPPHPLLGPLFLSSYSLAAMTLGGLTLTQRF